MAQDNLEKNVVVNKFVNDISPLVIGNIENMSDSELQRFIDKAKEDNTKYSQDTLNFLKNLKSADLKKFLVDYRKEKEAVKSNTRESIEDIKVETAYEGPSAEVCYAIRNAQPWLKLSDLKDQNGKRYFDFSNLDVIKKIAGRTHQQFSLCGKVQWLDVNTNEDTARVNANDFYVAKDRRGIQLGTLYIPIHALNRVFNTILTGGIADYPPNNGVQQTPAASARELESTQPAGESSQLPRAQPNTSNTSNTSNTPTVAGASAGVGSAGSGIPDRINSSTTTRSVDGRNTGLFRRQEIMFQEGKSYTLADMQKAIGDNPEMQKNAKKLGLTFMVYNIWREEATKKMYEWWWQGSAEDKELGKFREGSRADNLSKMIAEIDQEIGTISLFEKQDLIAQKIDDIVWRLYRADGFGEYSYGKRIHNNIGGARDIIGGNDMRKIYDKIKNAPDKEGVDLEILDLMRYGGSSGNSQGVQNLLEQRILAKDQSFSAIQKAFSAENIATTLATVENGTKSSLSDFLKSLLPKESSESDKNYAGRLEDCAKKIIDSTAKIRSGIEKQRSKLLERLEREHRQLSKPAPTAEENESYIKLTKNQSLESYLRSDLMEMRLDALSDRHAGGEEYKMLANIYGLAQTSTYDALVTADRNIDTVIEVSANLALAAVTMGVGALAARTAVGLSRTMLTVSEISTATTTAQKIGRGAVVAWEVAIEGAAFHMGQNMAYNAITGQHGWSILTGNLDAQGLATSIAMIGAMRLVGKMVNKLDKKFLETLEANKKLTQGRRALIKSGTSIVLETGAVAGTAGLIDIKFHGDHEWTTQEFAEALVMVLLMRGAGKFTIGKNKAGKPEVTPESPTAKGESAATKAEGATTPVEKPTSPEAPTPSTPVEAVKAEVGADFNSVIKIRKGSNTDYEGTISDYLNKNHEVKLVKDVDNYLVLRKKNGKIEAIQHSRWTVRNLHRFLQNSNISEIKIQHSGEAATLEYWAEKYQFWEILSRESISAKNLKNSTPSGSEEKSFSTQEIFPTSARTTNTLKYIEKITPSLARSKNGIQFKDLVVKKDLVSSNYLIEYTENWVKKSKVFTNYDLLCRDLSSQGKLLEFHEATLKMDLVNMMVSRFSAIEGNKTIKVSDTLSITRKNKEFTISSGGKMVTIEWKENLKKFLQEKYEYKDLSKDFTNFVADSWRSSEAGKNIAKQFKGEAFSYKDASGKDVTFSLEFKDGKIYAKEGWVALTEVTNGSAYEKVIKEKISEHLSQYNLKSVLDSALSSITKESFFEICVRKGLSEREMVKEWKEFLHKRQEIWTKKDVNGDFKKGEMVNDIWSAIKISTIGTSKNLVGEGSMGWLEISGRSAAYVGLLVLNPVINTLTGDNDSVYGTATDIAVANAIFNAPGVWKLVGLGKLGTFLLYEHLESKN